MSTLPVALRNTFAALSLAALVAACGGGASDESTAHQPSSPPATDTTTPDSDESTPDSGSTAPDNDQGQVEPTEPPPANARSATLVWDTPTTNTDGTCLAELNGYRVSYGLSPRVYSNAEALDASDVSCVDSGETDACGRVLTCTYTVENLDVATWYFAVQAIDSTGNTSDYSNDATKTIY